MAAKCNISGYAINIGNSLLYGFSCEDNSLAIIENYIEYLNCPNLPLQICYPKLCDNPVIVFNCNFNIINTKLGINNNVLTFTVDTSNYVGGTAPFTYTWTFEQDDFDAAGPINQSQTVLVLKPKKDLSQLVSMVSITITDANGCTDTKTCWLNKGDYRCSQNFHPCSNPKQLRVYENIIRCPAPHNLIVN